MSPALATEAPARSMVVDPLRMASAADRERVPVTDPLTM